MQHKIINNEFEDTNTGTCQCDVCINKYSIHCRFKIQNNVCINFERGIENV